jgi:hypothetical protein
MIKEIVWEGFLVIFPTIKGPINDKIHAIKNIKRTECGILFPEFFETLTTVKRNVKFLNINKISCRRCRDAIKQLAQ